jgi:hypothetical protein
MYLALPLPVSARLSEQASTILATPSPSRLQTSSSIRLAALIFNAIVQKCRNGKIFVAAVLKDCRSHREQVIVYTWRD